MRSIKRRKIFNDLPQKIECFIIHCLPSQLSQGKMKGQAAGCVRFSARRPVPFEHKLHEIFCDHFVTKPMEKGLKKAKTAQNDRQENPFYFFTLVCIDGFLLMISAP